MPPSGPSPPSSAAASPACCSRVSTNNASKSRTALAGPAACDTPAAAADSAIPATLTGSNAVVMLPPSLQDQLRMQRAGRLDALQNRDHIPCVGLDLIQRFHEL